MAFPGQKNAGRVYREFSYQNITGLVLPANIAAAGSANIRVPWAVDGYTRGQIAILLGARAAGTFTLKVKPWGSDAAAWPGNIFWPVTPALADFGGALLTAFNLNFFDGPLPGNWNLSNQTGTFTAGGNSLNPAMFTNAAMLEFMLENTTGAALPLNAWRFILSGGN